MPKKVFTPPDPANMASKLPRPLQWPAGAMGGLVQSLLGGDDPAGSMMGAATPLTTVGPGAIPLDKAGRYGYRAVNRVLTDMPDLPAEVLQQLPGEPPMHNWTWQFGKQMLDKDKALGRRMGAEGSYVDQLVQHLANYFSGPQFDPFMK